MIMMKALFNHIAMLRILGFWCLMQLSFSGWTQTNPLDSAQVIDKRTFYIHEAKESGEVVRTELRSYNCILRIYTHEEGRTDANGKIVNWCKWYVELTVYRKPYYVSIKGEMIPMGDVAIVYRSYMTGGQWSEKLSGIGEKPCDLAWDLLLRDQNKALEHGIENFPHWACKDYQEQVKIFSQLPNVKKVLSEQCKIQGE